jgi:hypothetical protein
MGRGGGGAGKKLFPGRVSLRQPVFFGDLLGRSRQVGWTGYNALADA